MVASAIETVAMLAAGVALVWHGQEINQWWLVVLGGILILCGVGHADWPTSADRQALRIRSRL